MKPVVIHTEAESELWQAVDFYEERAPGLGLDFEGEIRRIIASIQEAPKRYPKGKHGTRRCVTPRFPYAVFYIELTEIIWVVAFAHTSRRPYYWVGRAE